MTELEKREKEYCKEACGSYYYECHTECSSVEAFQAGAKWGAEHAIEWHNLRKNPKDLPKATKLYYCCAIYNYSKIYEHHVFDIGTNHFVGELGKIIAWCELPQFKDKE